jgi:GxxExxY protein
MRARGRVAAVIPTQNQQPKNYSKLIHGELTEKIIAAAIEVHRRLGPGLMESVYEQCFCRELEIRKIGFRRQLPVDIDYKGLRIEAALRPDLIVEDKIVVELKAAEQNHPVFETQVMTYLKLANKRVGLLINFGLPVLRQGIVRRVL